MLEPALHGKEAFEDLLVTAEILKLEHLCHHLIRLLKQGYLSEEAQVILAVDLQVKVLREPMLVDLIEAAGNKPSVDKELAHQGEDSLLAIFLLVLGQAFLEETL